ncbi:hypothetical protein AVDCRST_MAG92-4087 [uncultured Coleofasciculus sp.]|uniref:Uncharacterized protein n=1 Tax=uncultured Coleofasciculus sp. TaxID=1267456 RepID=A0A6J4JVE0_9CYAN|nr:hypothetical protein AVDCRST_MAG92-4087 [uncultured Coleofasciculus sp.]
MINSLAFLPLPHLIILTSRSLISLVFLGFTSLVQLNNCSVENLTLDSNF